VANEVLNITVGWKEGLASLLDLLHDLGEVEVALCRLEVTNGFELIIYGID
jgi:hypothetical protein